MSRGLSDLQQRILLMAYVNNQAERIGRPRYEVLVRGLAPEATSADGLPIINRLHKGDAVVLADAGQDAAASLAQRLLAAGMEAWDGIAEGPSYWTARICYWATGAEPRALFPEAFPAELPDGLWAHPGNALWIRIPTSVARPDVDAFYEQVRGRGAVVADSIHPHPLGPDLTFSEVLRSVYRCELRPQVGNVVHEIRPPIPDGYPRGVAERATTMMQYWLSKARTGAGAYEAAAVSTSKAFDRLEHRGLAHQLGWWRGRRFHAGQLALSEHGHQVAASLLPTQAESLPEHGDYRRLGRLLLANTANNIPSVSQYAGAVS